MVTQQKYDKLKSMLIAQRKKNRLTQNPNKKAFKTQHEATKQFTAMLVAQDFSAWLLEKWIPKLDKVFAQIMKVTELNYDILQAAYLTQIAGDKFPSKYNDLKKIPAFKVFISYINKIDQQHQ